MKIRKKNLSNPRETRNWRVLKRHFTVRRMRLADRTCQWKDRIGPFPDWSVSWLVRFLIGRPLTARSNGDAGASRAPPTNKRVVVSWRNWVTTIGKPTKKNKKNKRETSKTNRPTLTSQSWDVSRLNRDDDIENIDDNEVESEQQQQQQQQKTMANTNSLIFYFFLPPNGRRRSFFSTFFFLPLWNDFFPLEMVSYYLRLWQMS